MNEFNQTSDESQKLTAGASDISIRADNVRPMTAPFSFEALISPVDVASFFGDCWGARPLHIARQRCDFYGKLISAQELTKYVAQPDFFARNSVSVPRQGDGPPDRPPSSVIELHEFLLSGRSVRFRGIERFMDPSAPVIDLLRSMERDIQHPLESLSCYLSPANAAGLGPHHDESEIFTLQISGKKRWRIYHRIDLTTSDIRLKEPALDLILEPGDLLYLPSGWVHDVASYEDSFSLTVVFDAFRWNTMLGMLTSFLATTTAFNAPIPAGSLLAGSTQMSSQLADIIALLRTTLNLVTQEDLTHYLAPKLLTQMTLSPAEQLGPSLDIEQLTLESIVERLYDVPFHISRHMDKIEIVLPGCYVLKASAKAEPSILMTLARRGPFRIREIDGCLADSAKLVLARKLIGCKLLRMLPQSGNLISEAHDE